MPAILTETLPSMPVWGPSLPPFITTAPGSGWPGSLATRTMISNGGTGSGFRLQPSTTNGRSSRHVPAGIRPRDTKWIVYLASLAVKHGAGRLGLEGQHDLPPAFFEAAS